MSSFYRWTVRLGAVLLLVALFAAIAHRCGAQSLTANGMGRVTAWSQPAHCYQHRMDFRGDFTAARGPVSLRARLRIQRWGACDSKLSSALLNAESGRVMSRWQSVRLVGTWRWVTAGVQYDRRSVHHFWRHKDRHDHFPGSWQIGRRGCRGGDTPSHPPGEGCPSIGYWDGLRPVVALDTEHVTATILGPLWAWKSLTLPWPRWRARASAHWQRWTVRGYAQGGGHRTWRWTLRLSRQVTDLVRVAAVYGDAALPEWRPRPAQRLGLSMVIR